MEVALVTNQRKIKIDAVSWDDVSTDRYQGLIRDCKDFSDLVEVYSILYRIDYDMLVKCTDQSIIGPLSAATQFIAEDPHDFERPEFLTVNGQAYKVPKDLEKFSFGQMVQLRKIAEKKKAMEESISIAVAIWLQPIIDGTGFSMARALELEQEVLALPITKTFAIGFFYLRKLNKHGQVLVNAWHLLKTLSPSQIKKLISLRGLNVLSHLQI